jgi:hypothetical protein
MQDGLMMGLQRMDLQRRPRRACASRRMGSEQAHGKADDCFGVRLVGQLSNPSASLKAVLDNVSDAEPEGTDPH